MGLFASFSHVYKKYRALIRNAPRDYNDGCVR